MLADTDILLFAASTLILMVMSLFFTILLIRSKPPTMKKRLQKGPIEILQETKTVKTTKAPKIPKSSETSKKSIVAHSVKGCLHYLGYLEKLSSSSFPYECLACPKIGQCIGEREEKPEKVDSDMSQYVITTRIRTAVEKANHASWKDLRGKDEQAIPGDQVPELYELLRELGGRIKHDDWEYHCYEKPLNIVVRTKLNRHT